MIHNNHISLTAAVLAGGQSRRMGQNKAIMSLGGYTLIERVIETVAPHVSNTMIIANKPVEFSFLNLPVLRDEIPCCGPMGGLFTALTHCYTSHCLVVACDLPLISETLIQQLLLSVSDSEITTVDVGNGPEPLCAVYSRKCLVPIKRLIKAKDLKLKNLFAHASVEVCLLEDQIQISGNNPLLNVNTPEDLKKAGQDLNNFHGNKLCI